MVVAIYKAKTTKICHSELSQKAKNLVFKFAIASIEFAIFVIARPRSGRGNPENNQNASIVIARSDATKQSTTLK